MLPVISMLAERARVLFLTNLYEAFFVFCFLPSLTWTHYMGRDQRNPGRANEELPTRRVEAGVEELMRNQSNNKNE